MNPSPMNNEWLADLGSPLLDEAALARIADPDRPDRLAWNAFRTLALWDADAWVPRLAEIACGDASPLVVAEWGGAAVRPWGAGLDLGHDTDVVLDGPEAIIVVVATLRRRPPLDELRAGVLEALAEAAPPGRQPGFVMVVPPGTADLDPWLEVATTDEEWRDDRLGGALGAPSMGWLTWREVAELALDLAEEADELRAEAVHRLAGDVQAQFPDAPL